MSLNELVVFVATEDEREAEAGVCPEPSIPQNALVCQGDHRAAALLLEQIPRYLGGRLHHLG